MVVERVAPVRVASPCVNVCRIDAAGLCEGCARTLDEIARWTSMGEAERDQVMRELPGRRSPAYSSPASAGEYQAARSFNASSSSPARA